MEFLSHKMENTVQGQTFSAPYLKRLESECHVELPYCFPPFALKLNVKSPILAIDFRISKIWNFHRLCIELPHVRCHRMTPKSPER